MDQDGDGVPGTHLGTPPTKRAAGKVHLRDQNANVLRVVQLRPQTAYVSVPTRPPAAKWVSPPTEAAVTQACQVFGERGLRSEHLLGYEGNAFAFTGAVAQDLLSITAVHPMREDAVSEYLRRAQADWAVVRGLVERGQLVETAYSGHRFFTRRLTRGRRSGPDRSGAV